MDISKIGGMELNRLKQLEVQQAQQAQQAAAAATTETTTDAAQVQDNAAVIEKDTFVKQADLGKSQEELEALYTKFNTDGTEGLSDDEFSKLCEDALTAAEPEQKTYTVQSGDSLYKIARDMTGNGENYKELYELNKDTIGKNPSLIMDGAELKIPQSWQKTTSKDALSAEQLAAAETIDTITSQTPPEPGSLVGTVNEDGTLVADSTGKTSAEAAKVQSDLNTLNEALGKLPEGTPGRQALIDKILTYQDSLQEAFNTQETAETTETTTDTTTTGTTAASTLPTYDDDTVRSDMKTMDDAKLDTLMPEIRMAYMQSLQNGYTTGTEDDMVGRLAKSLLRTNPEALTQAADSMDDNAVRSLMNMATDEELFKMPGEALDKMLKKIEDGWTTGKEDELAGRITFVMACQGTLQPDVVEKMDDNAVRDLMGKLSDADLTQIPGETLGAMMKKLQKGYTSGTEDGLMGRCAVALAKSAPEAFTPDLVSALDDNGVREMVKNMEAQDMKNLSMETLSALVNELEAGWTSSEERGYIKKLTEAINLK